jgi:tetratricopeptide (TPR) repeat protein
VSSGASQVALATARAHRDAGRWPQALAVYASAVAAAPSAALCDEYAYALKDAGKYADAVTAWQHALDLGHPRPHEVELNRAVVYADHLRRDADAEAALNAALVHQPDCVPALMNLGNLHEQRGDRAAALAVYARVLGLSDAACGKDAPLKAVALARSAIIDPPASTDDPRLDALEQALDTVGGNHAVRVHVLFALGHARDRLGDADAAFDAYARGNRSLLRLHGRRYDRVHEERLTDALIAAFPMASSATDQSDIAVAAGPSPLFICGMFRSGSTLVEQVLAAHPDVVAGGEIDWFARLAAERLAPFPASVATLDDTRVGELASAYRDEVATLFPDAEGARYVTDKRPDNFQLVGLIKRLFPRARIVHTMRDPLDNGLSVFMQHLNPQVSPYACDLADIGHYYGQYRRLMAHWRDLYGDDILDYDYDAFVREPRASLQRLLAFLGLPWHEPCLDFHTLRNTVKTASYWQVRRPLYTDASGRWRRYRAHLGLMVRELNAAGVDLPTD